MARSELERFSRLVAAVHEASVHHPFDGFPIFTLKLLCSDLKCEAGWWGVTSDRSIRTSTSLGLPPQHAADWESTKGWDPIASEALSNPGRTAIFNAERLCQIPRKRAWLARYEIRHVMCTTFELEALNISMFLSLYRSRIAFTEKERHFKQQLMPHLTLALRANRHRYLHTLAESESAPGTGLAIVDGSGLIHCADRGFAGFIRLQWPGWDGPYLPDAITNDLNNENGTRVIDTGSLRVEITAERGLLLLRVVRSSVLRLLSARERDVAQAFAEGQSYKEIARQVGLAPTTVRHYLRNVYAKLGISNKAQLTGVVTLDGNRRSLTAPVSSARASLVR